MKQIFIFLFICSAASIANADWSLKSSKVDYEVHHPLHTVNGSTANARGKGVCKKSNCQFLVAAELKSFSSENESRDQHVLETVGAAKNPIVKIRFDIPDVNATPPIEVNAEIELNGETVSQKIKIQTVRNKNLVKASGQLDLLMTKFKIEPPSLLAISTKDNFEVRFDSEWEETTR